MRNSLVTAFISRWSYLLKFVIEELKISPSRRETHGKDYKNTEYASEYAGSSAMLLCEPAFASGSLMGAYASTNIVSRVFSVDVKIFKMATTFDRELRKAFQELQGKMIETTQRVKIAEGQIMQLRRNIAHAKLTDQELASLPTDTPTYESVGRMFVLQPVSDIRKELAEKLHNNEEKIKSIEANKEYLQRSVKEHEDNIREMLASRPK